MKTLKAAILNIGTELLMGMTVNTNSAYLSSSLNELGISVLFHGVVGDNPTRIKEEIIYYLSKVDILLTTGGLGPTLDDITKEVVADLFGQEMIFDEQVMQDIKRRFEQMNRPMTDNNSRQAYFPKGSFIMHNNRGTAPGCIAFKNDKAVLMFPGPPRELSGMFEEKAKPWLLERSDTKINSKYIRMFGIGESSAEDAILDLVKNQIDPTIGIYVKEGEVMLRVTSSKKDLVESDAAVESVTNMIRQRLGEYIFSENNTSLEEVVVQLLKDQNLKLTVVESCTGGMVGMKITSVPGSSQVFDRGYITYSNDSKHSDVGVSLKTLDTFGAVSHETALEMGKGAFENTHSDICLSITGIAGPEGGTEEKPVGLVYIAVCLHGKCQSFEFRFNGERHRIRTFATMNALNLIRKALLGKICI